MHKTLAALTLLSLFLIGGATASHVSNDYWLHCTHSDTAGTTCKEEAVPTVTSTHTVTVTQTVTTTPTPPPPSAPQPTIAAFPIGSGWAAAWMPNLPKHAYVTLNAWQKAERDQIKAANPNVKVLVYKDMASTRSYACSNGVDQAKLPTGVGYCYADKNAPQWFSTTSAGARIEWNGYPGHWQMDIGDAAYQNAWASNVIAEAKADGWDGISVDNANVDPGYTESGYMSGKLPSEYPTRASYEAATRSFLANVGPKVKAEGLLIFPNIQANMNYATPALWKDWTTFTSGGIREFLCKWGHGTTGHFGGAGCQLYLDTMAATQSVNRSIILSIYSTATDTRTMRWGRANFLLGWDGVSASALSFDTQSTSDPYNQEWVIDVGKPVGAITTQGNAKLREYSAGYVAANHSSSTAQTVTFPRQYRMPDGTLVTSTTLQPLTGLIVRSP